MDDDLDFVPIAWPKLPSIFWQAGVDLTGWQVAVVGDKKKDDDDE